VTYELRAVPGNFNYMEFFLELQRSLTWWHYLTNTWLVIRPETFEEMQRLFVPLISNQDSLLILPAQRPAVGYLPQDAWDWINRHLPFISQPAVPMVWVPPPYAGPNT
jgi:hypothetical protein